MKCIHEFKICLYIKEINSMINSKITEKLKKRDLTQSQVTAIKFVGHFDKLTLSELSKKMAIKKSTCSGIVDRLEKVDIFERVKDDEDKRITYIKFSEKGQVLSDEIKEDINNSFKEIFNGISEEDLKTIENGLEKIISLIKEN
ncbi:MarR family winged helix-turn-helix transcriptional regulator [Eubacterium multiforme]|uniref:DNA-binding MarR family transcriptional regulator n=1 Tax=Eubacterium multiforme TaxID=83339 RepID=A0ABT9UR33_9FIRM|nr:MarR family transcriptional regulator [Eubacterium multiforme]MDQ0149096.1 DNA-binding MarR family transcriptional regulator [Eubacterium multiforme]